MVVVVVVVVVGGEGGGVIVFDQQCGSALHLYKFGPCCFQSLVDGAQNPNHSFTIAWQYSPAAQSFNQPINQWMNNADDGSHSLLAVSTKFVRDRNTE